MTLAKKGKILAPLHNFQKRHVKFYKKWMVFELHILPSQNVVLFPHVESLCMFWLLRLIYWWSLNKNCISIIMEMCKCGKWLVQWSPRTIGAYWIWGDIDGEATSVRRGSRGGPHTLSSPVHILLSLPCPSFLIFSHILPTPPPSVLYYSQFGYFDGL